MLVEISLNCWVCYPVQCALKESFRSEQKYLLLPCCSCTIQQKFIHIESLLKMMWILHVTTPFIHTGWLSVKHQFTYLPHVTGITEVLKFKTKLTKGSCRSRHEHSRSLLIFRADSSLCEVNTNLGFFETRLHHCIVWVGFAQVHAMLSDPRFCGCRRCREHPAV